MTKARVSRTDIEIARVGASVGRRAKEPGIKDAPVESARIDVTGICPAGVDVARITEARVNVSRVEEARVHVAGVTKARV